MVRYLNNRLLLLLSAASLVLGIVALVLTLTSLQCGPQVTSGAQRCSVGGAGVLALPLYFIAFLLWMVALVLGLVKAGINHQWVWFGAMFLLGPVAILLYSLLTTDKPRETAEELHEPDHKDLRDFRSPRPA